jgi:hypothetical protein
MNNRVRVERVLEVVGDVILFALAFMGPFIAVLTLAEVF